MSFENLGLSQPLLKSVSKKGYTTPSPIQEKVIPHVLSGKDILASAQTGTGKTAGFALPVIQHLSKAPRRQHQAIGALILTPTRELAAQVHEDVLSYSEFVPLKSTVIFGGVGANPQIEKLKRGVDILIATPGRLLDLHQQKHLSLKKVEVLILDEADRMLDMGFLRDIQKILNILPPNRQNLLFSATFSKEIKKLAQTLLHNPISVEATPENTTVEKIDQKAIFVDKQKKTVLITELIRSGDWKQVLIFTKTKHGANRLGKKLKNAGLTAAEIHGNKGQGARTKALADFKKGDVRVLVATDIAARGLDIPLLPYVINFELPNVAEDYVHRIGRTGRAGAKGISISLVAAEELGYLKDIEKFTQQSIPSGTIPGYEPETPFHLQSTPAKQQAQEQKDQPRARKKSKRRYYRKPKA